MNVNERLKKVREAIGISQAKFAERIAISSSYISDLEKGSKEVNERITHLVSAKFNVNEEWLRAGQGLMFNENESVIVSEAINIFKSLDHKFQIWALKQLELLNEINNAMKDTR